MRPPRDAAPSDEELAARAVDAFFAGVEPPPLDWEGVAARAARLRAGRWRAAVGGAVAAAAAGLLVGRARVAFAPAASVHRPALSTPAAGPRAYAGAVQPAAAQDIEWRGQLYRLGAPLASGRGWRRLAGHPRLALRAALGSGLRPLAVYGRGRERALLAAPAGGAPRLWRLVPRSPASPSG
ncbi:MAG: hypothetical protein K6V73_01500 [Firmicutes bacterium]|nr:hypothetical protein [Bacillota bacterium]